jgi:hypothetical protein
MSDSSPPAVVYKWFALALIAITLLSLLPQIHLWLIRRSEWNGAYAAIQGDEFLYSAYINALSNGRSRRNDPFAGVDATPQTPLPESTFSIQFVPSSVISSVARLLSVSSATVFIALLGIGGLLAALTVYWLLFVMTRDWQTSTVGMLFVLTMGAVAAGQGFLWLLLNSNVLFLGLPFLRRYQPAAAFPLFFVFCTLVFKALTTEEKSRRRGMAAIAGLTIALLVFSYLYLWTAALAWLTILVAMWIAFSYRSSKSLKRIELFAIIYSAVLVALIPYFYLVSHRAAELDEAQTIILTHRPDLFRVPEIIGAVVLLVIAWLIRRAKVQLSEPRLVFAMSFAALPFVVFNQQVLTGRSMQPYHFETFVANYATLIALVVVANVLCNPWIRRRAAVIAVLGLLWGSVEVSMAVLAHYKSSIAGDQMVPVLLRLNDLSKQDGTLDGLRATGKTPTIVFSPQRDVMALLPTWTSQGTLLSVGGLDFGSASHADRKQFLYMYLYYSGIDAEGLRKLLNGQDDDFFMGHYARIAIFGHERVVPLLSSTFQPIQSEEIDQQVQLYKAYVDSFSLEEARSRPLRYVVIRTNTESTLSSIDRWYERDRGEQYGDYTLYRVRMRE